GDGSSPEARERPRLPVRGRDGAADLHRPAVGATTGRVALTACGRGAARRPPARRALRLLRGRALRLQGAERRGGTARVPAAAADGRRGRPRGRGGRRRQPGPATRRRPGSPDHPLP
ncbi:MAG: hypothetical protein AVDCRST_MAG79-348, partial [uncultured Thermoleophilia bacterium]